MPLHPITIVDRVIEEYRSYLMTEFRARDPRLRAALVEALDRKGFLAQEPFFQAHRPFKAGERWRDLGLDAKLAAVMEARSGSDRAYLHQSAAISTLLAADARPVVVTTGTGSGKTECFLLPVIQNAIDDAVQFHKHSGLTAILVYPMNALANDQEERIRSYLAESGHTYVQVAKYDRSTSATDRQQLRAHPPHILLTNYMMLEYLLVRPADRDALFANHRCRFLVLDEVHTYRGSLGANIALLVRRLRAHLARARQDWGTEDPNDRKRFPELLPVATSATIKSVEEAGRAPGEVKALRDAAVREFLERLTGVPGARFAVIGEELSDVVVPATARWTAEPVDLDPPDPADAAAVRRPLARLAGLPETASIDQAATHAGILWDLQGRLIRRPRSVTDLVDEIVKEVPERRAADPEKVRREVLLALSVGAALPDGTPGALRLRTHRFIRGGWRFARCVDPACGQIYAKGETECAACGRKTAPLFICRGCGAHALRFVGADEPADAPLEPRHDGSVEGKEWMLYDGPVEAADDEDVGGEVGEPGDGHAAAGHAGEKMKGRSVHVGSFDPGTCAFSDVESDYPVKAVLAPARNRCLVCGGTAGSRDILTPVALGTSAAVRVVAEGLVESLADQNRGRPGHDGKERLLIFSDSRQDAAHQARFITYAGRYDRMRRNLCRLLRQRGPLTLKDAVQGLMVAGVDAQDNPHAAGKKKADYLPGGIRANALAWEEAPLLDDLATSAGYRATILNLGLVGVRYDRLDPYVRDCGGSLAARLGIRIGQLAHLARCVLDEMRVHAALSRPMLCFHPSNPGCPEEFQKAADWERRIRTPSGYPCKASGEPLSRMDEHDVAEGLKLCNAWRASKGGRRPPSMEIKVRRLLRRMGGIDPTEDDFLALMSFLVEPGLIVKSRLFGFRQATDLLQVEADAVVLDLVAPADRRKCTVCHVRMPWAEPGAPCPACEGDLVPWPEEEIAGNRYVQRILKESLLPLVASEHTAQVTGEMRTDIEERFKAGPDVSPLNVLACSPTLEMGIDVGGLDAVVMRNVPPRPDNYSQRGGRAGRRTRVGVVLGYARNTPHDGYFYDKPAEMIAGEIPAPPVGLGNRDVVVRHLNAIALGGAEPGLSGRMVDYISVKGELNQEKVDELLAAVRSRVDEAVDLAMAAWGPDVLAGAGFDTRDKLKAALEEFPARIRDVFDRVRLQVVRLQETIDAWLEIQDKKGEYRLRHAAELKRRLLGIGDDKRDEGEADDRSAGYPMRRLAEFGLLPGYEFPSLPGTLRLHRDEHEEEPLSVERRFALGQYQPGAIVHARGHRWAVRGLDASSPWNPKTLVPGWLYYCCPVCGLRFGHDKHVKCPRCGCTALAGKPLPGFEFGGFLAVREDTPVLEEEDRFATQSLVRAYPQWDGLVVARYRLGTGWAVELRRGEEVRWVNEWKPPTPAEGKGGAPYLHDAGRGFYLCPSCGQTLKPDAHDDAKGKGRKKPRAAGDRDPYGHATSCERAGQAPDPLALVCSLTATTLRITVDVPAGLKDDAWRRWGYSLGHALRIGLRQLYLLEGNEIEFELEPMWEVPWEGVTRRLGALVFIDGAVGGSGFLDRAAGEFHLVAARAIEHLKHEDCEVACYRCLKSYNNQRIHSFLSWPHALPDLELLAATPPEPLPAGVSDAQDPRPWLEAYAEGVGSPLELRFLRLFQKHGVAVEKQVPVAPADGARPISTADFVVTGRKVAVYVDGAAFHVGNNLRRDRYIRERLRAGGWRVVELAARDLHDTAWIGEFSAPPAAPGPVPKPKRDDDPEL